MGKQTGIGLMLTQTRGDGTYQLQGDDKGTVRERAHRGLPLRKSLISPRQVSAWVLAGVGAGEVTLRSQKGGAMPTDLSMRLGAVGVKGKILDGSGPSGIGLNVKFDAMWVGR